MSEHNDAVLLYHNPDTTILELLVDSQRRTDVAVQQKVMSLMEENPGVTNEAGNPFRVAQVQ
ncbi:Uncharacterised protein [Salmonella enterica subsp. enterica serovar Typhi]|nr:Uncharacterised protein [Salmonella enterica subsp. enterica serovar Typhi]